MNTHDKYELPPLPEWLGWPVTVSEMTASEIKEAMQAFARSAIESDRQRRDNLNAVADALEGADWSGVNIGNTALIKAAVEELRKRRGEPVAFFYELATTFDTYQLYSGWSPRLTFSMPNVPDGSIRNLKALYAAPQPEEQKPIRTDQQIVDQTEELARMLLLQFHGTHPSTPEFLMRNAIEGRAARAWAVACMIQDLLTDTDVTVAIDNLEEA